MVIDSYDVFRVRTIHRTTPQLPTIQCSSNEAVSRIQCAEILFQRIHETIPRGPILPKEESRWPPPERHPSPDHFLEVCVIFWDVVLLCRCREPKQTPLHTLGTSMSYSRSCRMLFACIAWDKFSYPHMGGQNSRTRPVRVVQQVPFSSFSTGLPRNRLPPQLYRSRSKVPGEHQRCTPRHNFLHSSSHQPYP